MGGETIIGELSINCSVQFIILSQIWGSGFQYTVNIWARNEATGLGGSVVTSSNGNPGSGTVIGSWGGRFHHSTVNWSGKWDVSVNASPDYSPRSPISPRVS